MAGSFFCGVIRTECVAACLIPVEGSQREPAVREEDRIGERSSVSTGSCRALCLPGSVSARGRTADVLHLCWPHTAPTRPRFHGPGRAGPTPPSQVISHCNAASPGLARGGGTVSMSSVACWKQGAQNAFGLIFASRACP